MSPASRIEMEAERRTTKRMGRERNDETEEDEAWDLEYAQAIEDVLCDAYDNERDRQK